MYDLLIIGGGINGAGIARDAAGRGLRVVLVEREDLAQHTSSASSKLIHGGLRYLEHGEFRLVREALGERETLLRIAPHIIWPLRFVLPYGKGLRPFWLLRLGLFLYDHLARLRTLPASHAVRFAGEGYGAALRPGITRGFVYSDCWVQDSRLVVLNALDAAERGAQIRTRTALVSARREGAVWQAVLRDETTGATETITARAIANCAGAWVAETLGARLGVRTTRAVRLVKGSHIVVPRLYTGDHAYILQNPDRRIVFAIPYEGRFTLIGTTDVPLQAMPARVAISPEETAYLCDTVNRWFRHTVTPADVVWSYAGVRPLYDDHTASGAANASAITRDYVLDLDAPTAVGAGTAPVLSVFGGKITTYRRLAEHALQKLAPHLPTQSPWTATAPLPGGDFPDGDFDAFLHTLQQTHPFLPPGLAHRLARAYGTRVADVLGNAQCLTDLGAALGGLYQAEWDYLTRVEWARTAEDVLWRRTKLGLGLGGGVATGTG